MKQIILLIFAAVISFFAVAQSPQSFQYQAVIRDVSGNVLQSQSVNLRLSIIPISAVGAAEYVETHTILTNAFGIVSLSVGTGNVVTGDFLLINWGATSHFIKVEADLGSGYINMGTTQLLSVPYAMYSQTAGNVDTLWNKVGNNIYNANPGNVGVGLNNPSGRMVVQGSSTALPTDPLFEVKNSIGQTVFVVYQDSVNVFVNDEAIQSNRGGFAVSGRNNTKAFTNKYLHVTPDNSKIWTKDTLKGFGVENINGVNKTSYMKMTPDNYLIGHLAGNSITIGKYNSFIGYQSGYSNTVGNKNYFIGYRSGYGNLGGASNIFIGDSTGFNNSSGLHNIFIGNKSGFINTIGNYNLFMGFQAGYNNTSDHNIFMGYESGKSNTIGTNNTFIGFQSGYKHVKNSSNIFIGNSSGYNDSIGNYNIFLGFKAGYSNKTGLSNIVIGNDAGGSSINNLSCVIIGNTAAKYKTDDGFSNVFIGNVAGQYGSGDFNVAVGGDAGSTVVGSRNTCIGQSAGKGVTGDNNVFIGNTAGYLIGAISNRVILGSSAITTMFCHGAYAATTANAANMVVLSTGQILRSTSSKRYKKEITDLTINTENIYKLRPVSYISITDDKPYFGLIAEEVASVIPELAEYAVEKDVIKGSNSEKLIPDAVKYPMLSVLLLKELQKQHKEITDLKASINNLESQNIQLKSNFETLKAEIEKIKNYQTSK
jgi:hypothetical protein